MATGQSYKLGIARIIVVDHHVGLFLGPAGSLVQLLAGDVTPPVTLFHLFGRAQIWGVPFYGPGQACIKADVDINDKIPLFF